MPSAASSPSLVPSVPEAAGWSPSRAPRGGPVRVAVVGLGVLGRSVAAGVARRRDLVLAGVVDADPALHGTTVELEGGERATVAAALPAAGVDVVALLTTSRVEEVGALALDLLGRGIDVITAAEELTFPWRSHPEWSARLDAAGRAGGASLLSVGANPGLLMETLPTVLSLATQRISSIAISRTMDVRIHRPARLRRFGLGLTPEAFAAEPEEARHGHVGFRQSIDALASALDLPIDGVVQRPLSVAVIADDERRGDHAVLAPGTVAVVEQRATAMASGRPLIELREHFGFVDPEDPVPHGDRWQIVGSEQRFVLDAPDGVHSFSTTPATVVNMIGPLRDAAPGLRVIGEFPVRELASKGWRRG
ncbi:hypothetical protein [Patulibacter defluvii]|uniref:hypothetical protein n=1 Tax=Patulibacter defluvii TaxID=3095358 RepID=UPI002A762739|nr:hypothetical protein [Patulibacter sp. DM4]